MFITYAEETKLHDTWVKYAAKRDRDTKLGVSSTGKRFHEPKLDNVPKQLT
jgi:hypothetical protein